MIVLNDVLGYKNRKIYQDNDYFKFSLDGVLLANFVSIKLTTKKIIDIGTGTGIIPLILSLKTNKKIDAVEVQKELCNLLKKTLSYNKLSNQINLINLDIKDYAEDNKNINKYDIVISNPPYYKNGKENPNKIKSNARHDTLLDIKKLAIYSKRLLKDKGSLYLVYDSKYLADVVNKLTNNGFSLRKIQFVHYNSKKKASIFLLECIKNGKCDLEVLPPFILYEKDGIMTNEYKSIYNGSWE